MCLVTVCNSQLGAKGSLYREDAVLSCRQQEFQFMHLLCRSATALVEEWQPSVLLRRGINGHNKCGQRQCALEKRYSQEEITNNGTRKSLEMQHQLCTAKVMFTIQRAYEKVQDYSICPWAAVWELGQWPGCHLQVSNKCPKHFVEQMLCSPPSLPTTVPAKWEWRNFTRLADSGQQADS